MFMCEPLFILFQLTKDYGSSIIVNMRGWDKYKKGEAGGFVLKLTYVGKMEGR